MWAAPPPVAAGPVASVGQRIGARLVDGVLHLLLLAVAFLLVPADRLLARLFVGLALITAYETICASASGSTAGKLITGTKVVQIDRDGIDNGVAAKRGLLVAISGLIISATPLFLVATAVADADSKTSAITVAAMFCGLSVGIITSVFGSPLRRSFIDRVADTFVVTRDTPTPVLGTAVDVLVDAEPAPTSEWGELATFDQRRRARAARLDDAPFLVLAMVAVVFATSVPSLAVGVFVALGMIWEVVFVADETWRVSRFGATSGHHRLGLAVVDVATGEAPSPVRSFVRAVLVSLPLYVLPMVLLVSIATAGDHPMSLVPAIVAGALLIGFIAWLRINPGRGVHDMAAHTAVIALIPRHAAEASAGHTGYPAPNRQG